MKAILAIFDTRPEAIKMAPVVRELARSDKLNLRIRVAARHRYRRMARASNPYGDGFASRRIRKVLKEELA